MLELPKVTLVSILTRQHEEGRALLSDLLSKARFGNVVIFTNSPESYPECCRSLVTPREYKEWCVFRMIELPKFRYKFLDYILFVETDTRIVNPAAWSDEFYGYDYIGAPWPHDHSRKKFFTGRVVGNGGFCLMSQKMLAAIDALKLPPTVEACNPCDMKVCLDHRAALEAAGCRYAPLDVADRFSNETGDYLGAFGAHSRYMLDLVKWKEILSRSPAGQV